MDTINNCYTYYNIVMNKFQFYFFVVVARIKETILLIIRWNAYFNLRKLSIHLLI
jgi:hypothetical protein